MHSFTVLNGARQSFTRTTLSRSRAIRPSASAESVKPSLSVPSIYSPLTGHATRRAGCKNSIPGSWILSPGCRVCRVCRVLSGPVGELSESCRAVVLSGLSGSVVSCRMSCRVLSGFSDSDHVWELSGPVGSCRACRTVVLSYCRSCQTTVG